MMRPGHFPIPAGQRRIFSLGVRHCLSAYQGRRKFSITLFLSRKPLSKEKLDKTSGPKEEPVVTPTQQPASPPHHDALVNALERHSYAHGTSLYEMERRKFMEVLREDEPTTPFSKWTYWPLPEDNPRVKVLPWVRPPHDYGKVYKGDKMRNFVMEISSKMVPGHEVHFKVKQYLTRLEEDPKRWKYVANRTAALGQKLIGYDRDLRQIQIFLLRDKATLLLISALRRFDDKYSKPWIHTTPGYRKRVKSFLEGRFRPDSWRSSVTNADLVDHALVMDRHCQDARFRYQRRVGLEKGNLAPFEVERAEKEKKEAKGSERVAKPVQIRIAQALALVERAKRYLARAGLEEMELKMESWEREFDQITAYTGRVLRRFGIISTTRLEFRAQTLKRDVAAEVEARRNEDEVIRYVYEEEPEDKLPSEPYVFPEERGQNISAGH